MTFLGLVWWLFFGVWGVGVVVSRGSRVVQIFYKAHSSRGFVLVLVLVLVLCVVLVFADPGKEASLMIPI